MERQNEIEEFLRQENERFKKELLEKDDYWREELLSKINRQKSAEKSQQREREWIIKELKKHTEEHLENVMSCYKKLTSYLVTEIDALQAVLKTNNTKHEKIQAELQQKLIDCEEECKNTKRNNELTDQLESTKTQVQAEVEKSLALERMDLTTKLSQLEDIVNEKKQVIVHNYLEIAAMKREKKEIQERFCCCSLRTQQTPENVPEQPEKSDKHSNQSRSFYIKLLNEKVLEVQTLKTELNESTRLLQKATKPAKQRIRSWINKKVLRIAQPAQEVIETAPSLYMDEGWAPGFTDHYIVPPMHSCADGMTSAQPSTSGVPPMTHRPPASSGDASHPTTHPTQCTPSTAPNLPCCIDPPDHNPITLLYPWHLLPSVRCSTPLVNTTIPLPWCTHQPNHNPVPLLYPWSLLPS